MLGRFMAVLYRGGFLSWLAWKTLVKTPRISIPNLLAGEELYPELIQGRATGRNAFSALLGFLEDERAAEHIRVGLLSARKAMGLPGAVDFWAERLEALLSGQTAFPGERCGSMKSVLLLANGPEALGWVRPVAAELKRRSRKVSSFSFPASSPPARSGRVAEGLALTNSGDLRAFRER